MADGDLFDIGSAQQRQKRDALEVLANEGSAGLTAFERSAQNIQDQQAASLQSLDRDFLGPEAQAQLGAVARRPGDAGLVTLGIEQGVFENQIERRQRAINEFFEGIDQTIPLLQTELELANARRGGGGGGGGGSAATIVPQAVTQAREGLQARTIADPLFLQTQRVAQGANPVAGLEPIDAMFGAQPQQDAANAAFGKAAKDVAGQRGRLAAMRREKERRLAVQAQGRQLAAERAARPTREDVLLGRPARTGGELSPGALFGLSFGGDIEALQQQAQQRQSLGGALRDISRRALQAPPTLDIATGIQELARLQDVEDQARRTASQAALNELGPGGTSPRARLMADQRTAFGVAEPQFDPDSLIEPIDRTISPLQNLIPNITAPEGRLRVPPSPAPLGERFGEMIDPVSGDPLGVGLRADELGFAEDIENLRQSAITTAIELGLPEEIARREITSEQILEELFAGETDLAAGIAGEVARRRGTDPEAASDALARQARDIGNQEIVADKDLQDAATSLGVDFVSAEAVADAIGVDKRRVIVAMSDLFWGDITARIFQLAPAAVEDAPGTAAALQAEVAADAAAAGLPKADQELYTRMATAEAARAWSGG